MRCTRALAATAAAVCLGAGLAACTPTPDGPPVAVLFPGGADDDWGASAAVLRDELADDGYAVEVRFAGDDIPRQLEQLKEVLGTEPAAVVIAPVDATSIAAVIADAPASVSVIAYDTLVTGSVRVDYFATFDHREAGRMQARALVDGIAARAATEADGATPPAVELLAGSTDDRGAQEAFAGALEVLQPLLDAGELAVPSGRVTFEQAAILRGDPATAAERVTALLDDGAELAGVLSPSDAMTAAVAAELADRGAASVVLTGGGSTLDGVRAVRDRAQSSTVYEDPRELARSVADMVRQIVAGSAPTVTDDVTTDNGIRDVPTRLLPPRLVSSPAEARELLG